MDKLFDLSSYLPFPLAAQLLREPGQSLIGQSERFAAVTLFADMAGFTPLSEALGQAGLEGTEELTRILNGRFTPMIEEIQLWGGVVGKFAGSSLTNAAAAERHSSPGEIVLHPSLRDRISPGPANLLPLAGGYARLQGLRLEVAPAPHPALPGTPDREQTARSLRPFLPPLIYDRLLSDQEAFVNEHRRLTVLFVGFAGIDYGAAEAVEQLGDYVERVVEIVARFDGYVCLVDMGDKGSRVMILFGAPVAHEDDEERALLCALALQQLPQVVAGVSSQRIGINSGRVFVGNVGSPRRQGYTAIGDAVNLSSRLMDAARPGQTLVGDSTYLCATDSFAWNVLPPMRVKGKSQPIALRELVECLSCQSLRLQEPGYALPMVGRREELAQLEALLAQVRELERGYVVGITAEAGLGKSRLAAAVIGRALSMGFVGYGGNGVSHGTTTPYLAWRPLLRGLLDLEEGLPLAEQIETARARLHEVHPDLPLRLPLLGDLLGLDIPDNELTTSFDAELRRRSLSALVADVIRHRSEFFPLLLVLEDAHWLDDLSRELTVYVARRIADLPVFLLTLYRPPEIARRPPLLLYMVVCSRRTWLGADTDSTNMAPPRESAVGPLVLSIRTLLINKLRFSKALYMPPPQPWQEEQPVFALKMFLSTVEEPFSK